MRLKSLITAPTGLCCLLLRTSSFVSRRQQSSQNWFLQILQCSMPQTFPGQRKHPKEVLPHWWLETSCGLENTLPPRSNPLNSKNHHSTGLGIVLSRGGIQKERTQNQTKKSKQNIHSSTGRNNTEERNVPGRPEIERNLWRMAAK